MEGSRCPVEGSAPFVSGCYSPIDDAAACVRVRILVVGVFDPSLCLDCGGMKNPSIGG